MDTMLATARRGHPGLYGMAIGMAVFAALLVGLAVVDPRELLGAPLWFKPLKFAVSFTAYGLALAWMLGRLPKPALQRTGWVVVAASVVEMVIIAGQAARGQLSHFNDDGGTGTLLFSIMGATVVVLYLMTAVVAVRFLRERSIEPELAAAIRIGLGLTLVGMAVGYVMVAVNSHAVGVPDGGPGLPLVGWNTTGGDLRIAHFVGLHALQVLPLAGAALARFAPDLGPDVRVRVLGVVGAGYLGLILALTGQALRAQPLPAPDSITVALLATIVVGTGVGLRAVTRTAVTV
jgi:hypothetical protein